MNGIFTNTINGIFRKEQDKAAAAYILNPETHPENTQTFEESLDIKEGDIREVDEIAQRAQQQAPQGRSEKGPQVPN